MSVYLSKKGINDSDLIHMILILTHLVKRHAHNNKHYNKKQES